MKLTTTRGKKATKLQMIKRASLYRDEFRLYLKWKLADRHGDKFKGIITIPESTNVILEYWRQDVDTGAHDKTAPMDIVKALRLTKKRIFIQNRMLYFQYLRRNG